MEASLTIRSTLLAIILAASFITGPVTAQNCGCAADQCCSQYGYCGLGDEYCGEGCKEGPCTGAPATPTPTPTGDVSVADLVTADFFNGIINQAAGTCEGKSFYTRDAFVNALGSFPDFGKVGSADDSKREVAAFFAHVTHETGHFCFINEDQPKDDYCDPTYTQYPCAAGKRYFGRGPLQLSWNYNYGAAGESLKFDGLGNPDSVASDPVLAFKTALWYWMQNVRSVVMNQGFGATTRAINGDVECDGKEPGRVRARADYYTDYCTKFNVSPGDNLTC